MHIEAGEAMREILAKLGIQLRLARGKHGLNATLRPYQQHGVHGFALLPTSAGECLADDMGLGKTIQILALLLHNKNDGKAAAGRRSWSCRLRCWATGARKRSGSREASFDVPAPFRNRRPTLENIAKSPDEQLATTDLAVTTYSMVTRQEWLSKVNWRLVILDEAQAIKNAGTRQTRAVKRLPARARIVLTGTPVENRLGDLWSIFDFLNPGLLGSASIFKTFVNGLRTRSSDQYAPLRRLVAPYILRRLKTDRAILSDLPDKVETTRYCNLTKTQIALYERVVETMKSTLENVDGMQRRALVLQTLMRLKQVCNHPSQLTGDGGYTPEESGKFLRIAEFCEELANARNDSSFSPQFV